MDAETWSRRPGTWSAIAAGLDRYHATNLLEALRMVPDTGDWHGSLRIACRMVLDRDGDQGPNVTAEVQMTHDSYGKLAPRG